MSASWMVYATCVAVLLALGAIFLERPLRGHITRTRVLWIGILAGALVWPSAVVMLARRSAGERAGPIDSLRPFAASPIAMPEAAAPSFAPAVTLPAVVPASATTDRIVRGIAIAGPLLVLAVLLVEMVRIGRARRRWHPYVIDSVPVLLSDNFGPAIVGVLHPEIVIPAWALTLPRDQRALMLAHEAEHLATHDSRWLGLAFVAVLIAPWNIGLWWLMRRFRLAMEVDCDRRVLQRGYDLEQYGNLLIRIGRHGAGRSLLAAGFAERRSMLRARLDCMTAATRVSWGRLAYHFACGITLVLGACLLSPSRSAGPRVAIEQSVTHQTAAPNVPFATDTAAPRNVRTMLDRVAVPTMGAPSITTRFSRDTVRIGEQVELVTVTWFPRALRDSMRHVPILKLALLTGPSSPRGRQHQALALERNVGGQLYDGVLWWRSFSATGAGLIVSPAAQLTYSERPAQSFPPASEERKVVESAPAVVVVRP